MTDIESIKYPIGRMSFKEVYTAADVSNYIASIRELPAKLRALTGKLSEEQLDTSYREGGWSMRQVIHHLADSHLNAFTRFKLTITEDCPTVCTYKESLWGETVDAKNAPVELSLKIIEGVHSRLVMLVESLDEKDLSREYFHPERNRKEKLIDLLGIYGWHSEHHYQQIKRLADRMGW